MLCHVVLSRLVQFFMWFPRENIAGVRELELGLLQRWGGVWGPGPSVVGVGRFYGRLVLENTSKIAFGKVVWSSFSWLLAVDSV
jgi:hypothetical protein